MVGETQMKCNADHPGEDYKEMDGWNGEETEKIRSRWGGAGDECQSERRVWAFIVRRDHQPFPQERHISYIDNP